MSTTMALHLLPVPVATSGNGAAGTVPCARAMWIDLTEPVVSKDLGPQEAARRRERIAAQQDDIAVRLREMGIEEIARVRHARNAMLVCVTAGEADTISRWPGVAGLRPADRLHPPVIDEDGPPDTR